MRIGSPLASVHRWQDRLLGQIQMGLLAQIGEFPGNEENREWNVAKRMDLSLEFRIPIAKRHSSKVVSRTSTPNTFMPSFETAYSSRTTEIWRTPSVSTRVPTISECGIGW